MDRYDPLNAAAPGEAYKNANLVTGDAGSYLDAHAFDAVMTEIVGAIAALGGVPSNADWHQLGTRIVAYVAAQIAAGAGGKVSKSGDTMTGPLAIALAGNQLMLNHTDNTLNSVWGHLWLKRGDGTGKTAQFVSVGDGANGMSEFHLRTVAAGGSPVTATFKFKDSGRFEVGADPLSAFEVSTKQYTDARATPTGAIGWFPATAAPTGFIKANGSLVSRTTYAALWAYAQASGNIAATDGAWAAGQFSPGDGATTFRIPDLRGEFIRGFDDARGVDSGRTIGSWQQDALKSHTHTLTASTTPEGTSSDIDREDGNGSKTSSPITVTTAATGGTETRPRNVAMLACIKY
ncbi:MAG TPA: phage tail protein [Novosphingobium sp.]|nr:phage tail protein [Novosphingobium sp.]